MHPLKHDHWPKSGTREGTLSSSHPISDISPPATRQLNDTRDSTSKPRRGISQAGYTMSTYPSPYSTPPSISGYGSIGSYEGPASYSCPQEWPQIGSTASPWARNADVPLFNNIDTREGALARSHTLNISQGDERRSKRYRGGRDEFEGSIQYLEKPSRALPDHRERDLPLLPIHLEPHEQDDILTQVNQRLSQCAFDFVALYRFPIPLEPNKPAVQTATDKVWTEWAYLLKRLATKRKIPSHAVYNGQIKELTTVLDNSLEMRHATKPRERPLKDDRAVLQFISAGIQVGRILKDAATMEYLDELYQRTERTIKEHAASPRYLR